MKRLRNSGLSLSVSPLYTKSPVSLKICYLKVRSLHKHIDDIRKDLNYSNTDISIFSETRFTHSDHDSMYAIDGYSLFRNDCHSNSTTRPFGGTAVYSRLQFIPDSPCCFNRNGVELTIMKCMCLPYLTIIGVYRSPKVPVTQLCIALRQVLLHTTTQYNIFLGDFNVNWLNETDRVPLYYLFITENNYRQLVSLYTTDNKTAIDHTYTNLPESQAKLHLLETYFSHHKAICALINSVNTETSLQFKLFLPVIQRRIQLHIDVIKKILKDDYIIIIITTKIQRFLMIPRSLYPPSPLTVIIR